MRLLVLALVAAPLGAQTPTVRLLNAPDASSKRIFGDVAAVRQLANGSILVNDPSARQLSVLDPTLQNTAILADSAAGSANYYGSRPGGLTIYLGDSTLFVDRSSATMLVIDPSGKVVRVVSVPRSDDVMTMGNGPHTGADARGRIIYRNMPRFLGGVRPGGGGSREAGSRSGGGTGGGPPPVMVSSDSEAIVRVDLKTRRLDTVAMMAIKNDHYTVTKVDNEYKIGSRLSPYFMVDEFVVLSDGTLAIVRGRDYHVDFITTDGTKTSGPKISYDWKRMSEDAKIASLDSAIKAWRDFFAGRANAPMPGWVSPAELPDYLPAFPPDAARADADANVWVRTNATRAGSAGAIYDVINRRGELIDRVQIPPGRQIVGFGKGGVVYMYAPDQGGGWIERSKR